MAKTLNINGEASIYVGTGEGGALQELGVSVDGVTITEETKFKDVKIDTYGSEIPFDKVYAGTLVTVDMELIWYDVTVMAAVQKYVYFNATPGLMGTVGTLAVAGGNCVRLLIQSPIYDQPYNFPLALIMEPQENKRNAVDPIVYKMKWVAMPAQQAGSTDDALIWNTTDS